MQIESLKQYIIIDSQKINLRVITRKEEGNWNFTELNSVDDKTWENQIVDLSVEQRL